MADDVEDGSHGVLKYVQRLWSSDNPTDRIAGYILKLLIEGALFGTFSGILVFVGYMIHVYDIYPIPFDPVVIFIGAWIILFQRSFCKLITKVEEPSIVDTTFELFQNAN